MIGAHFLRGLGVRRAVRAGLVLLAVAIFVLIVVFALVCVAVVAQLQRLQQVMNRVAKLGLILGEILQHIEARTDLVLEDRPPEVDHLARGHRRREPGQPFAHHHRQRIGQRRIGAVGDFVVFAAMEMIVEHRSEVLGDAAHALGADRLDTGLLDGIEHAPRLRIAGHQLAMNFRIVTRHAQRNGVRMAAHDGGILAGQLARRFRQPRLAGRQARTLGGEGHFKFGLLGDGPQRRRHRALERLRRRFLRPGPELDIRRAHATFPPRSKGRGKPSSTPH